MPPPPAGARSRLEKREPDDRPAQRGEPNCEASRGDPSSQRVLTEGWAPSRTSDRAIEQGEAVLSRVIWVSLLSLAVSGLAISQALAEPAPSYADLLRNARLTAPRLVESGANVGVAKGEAVQARVRPNPVVELGVEDIGVHDPSGLSRQQTTLSVGQTLEFGGKRQARISASGAEVGAAQARQQKVLVDFAYDLAIAYAAAEAAQKRTQLFEDDLGRAREDLRAARALVDAGKEADLRAVQAHAATTAADAELQAARADLGEALASLSILVGAPQAFTGVQSSLLDRAESLKPPAADTLQRAPGVLVAEAERRAAALRVEVERARGAPDVTLSVGARRYGGEDDTGLVAGVSVPLPLFDRNRGSVSAAVAQLAAADARLNGAQLEADTGRRVAASQIVASDARLTAALQSASAAREAYDLARVGYDGGKAPLIELLNARRAITDAEARLLDARSARIRAEAALARLSGRVGIGE